MQVQILIPLPAFFLRAGGQRIVSVEKVPIETQHEIRVQCRNDNVPQPLAPSWNNNNESSQSARAQRERTASVVNVRSTYQSKFDSIGRKHIPKHQWRRERERGRERRTRSGGSTCQYL